MTLGCYFQPVNEGAIIVEPFGSTLTPIGRVFELCRGHQGQQRLSGTASGATGSFGWIASEDLATQAREVTLINRSLEHGCQVKLVCADVESVEFVEGRQLQGDKVPLPASAFSENIIEHRRLEARTIEVAVPACSVVHLRIRHVSP
jgi:hypothetical protein